MKYVIVLVTNDPKATVSGVFFAKEIESISEEITTMSSTRFPTVINSSSYGDIAMYLGDACKKASISEDMYRTHFEYLTWSGTYTAPDVGLTTIPQDPADDAFTFVRDLKETQYQERATPINDKTVTVLQKYWNTSGGSPVNIDALYAITGMDSRMLWTTCW